MPPRPRAVPSFLRPAAPDPGPLRGRVVLVTGGAQGIGRGIAQAVLAAGGRVLIGDVDGEAGRACLDEWQAGDAAAFQPLDVSREASVQRFVAGALRRFGRIDGLVNNAGIADPHTGPLERLDLREWRRRLGVNLDGAFLCASTRCQPCGRRRPAVRSSTSPPAAPCSPSPTPRPTRPARGGLLAFTHALAISAGPAVRVNAISPGWIATDAWRSPPRAGRRS